MTDHLRLSPEQLSWHCDPAQFEFASTEELEALETTIGQDRAVTAISFGLGIRDSGFNLFLLGEPGTGRSSTIKKILGSRAAGEATPDDWCYLHDFQNGERPTWIRVPAGIGRRLQREVEELILQLAEEIPKVFEGKEYETRKNRISQEHQEETRRLFQKLEEKAQGAGFLLQRSVSGLVLVPTREGEPLSQQDYEGLPQEEQEKLDKRGGELQEELNEALRKARDLEKEMRKRQSQMEKDILMRAVSHLFEEVEEHFRKYPDVLKHFDNCKRNICERIEDFRSQQSPKISIPGLQTGSQENSFERFRVNLLVDNAEQQGAPVVYEPNPTYFNVFGRIEHVIQMGNATTNFTMIKAGALHRANGGYLILDCREVLLNLFTYEALKRSIRNRELKIEDMTEQFRLIATVSLKPQPVPLDCKIILIGPPQLYYLLYEFDPDFRKYFKVKADFDHRMPNNWENLLQYARFVGAKCREENLVHFSPEAVARLAEYSARLIPDQRRLSSRFLEISNLIREASFYAEQGGRKLVAEEQVQLALEAKIYRSNKVEEWIQEMIEDGTLLVDTEGVVVGQVNGLAVFQLGDSTFGKPARVTVRTHLGKGGVVNIEREAKLSGPIHDKGLLILSGFFGARFAQDKLLNFSASICFEQSYAGIDGDSASSTELYGLLSSLAGLPIRQSIAVTGSVDQRGQLQPIGGVNEKIEGFFDVCRARGLTGEQGVVIPVQNLNNLMLRREVRDAVHEARFHVWAIATIDEGMEILTGVPAGVQDATGKWPEGSVNARVDRRLRELTEVWRSFGKKEGAD